MLLLVCYDVQTTTKEGRRRLRRVAKLCESHGQRVQFSLFEIKLEKKDYLIFESRILKIMDPRFDNLRIYFLEEGQTKQAKQYGNINFVDYEAPQII